MIRCRIFYDDLGRIIGQQSEAAFANPLNRPCFETEVEILPIDASQWKANAARDGLIPADWQLVDLHPDNQ